MKKINVTRTFLPPLEEYEQHLQSIWQNNQLTNQGPLLKTFEKEASKYLNVENFHFVANGTIALQLAIRALGIEEGEIITTPFSYVASTSAILWEHCDPVFVDIEKESFCIDPSKIESAITDRTKAILAVHVFGNPCDIDAIEQIAKEHRLKVIYDAAHAFGVKYKSKSLLSYGDISICSFHSTKLFHTIEGGCVIARDSDISSKLELMKKFGHKYDEHFMLGINAKASEFQAAMGLCNLKYISQIIEARGKAIDRYNKQLDAKFQRLKLRDYTEYNNAYYPIVLESEEQLKQKIKELEANNIYPRRYFYPSLNTLPYLKSLQSCPVSEDISKRILCLPLYHDLEEDIIDKICEVINK